MVTAKRLKSNICRLPVWRQQKDDTISTTYWNWKTQDEHDEQEHCMKNTWWHKIPFEIIPPVLHELSEHVLISLLFLNYRATVLFPSGLFPSGLIPSGLFPSGLFPSVLFPSVLFPSGLFPSGLIPSGLIPSGLIPSGLFPSGLFPSGLIPSGLISSGLIPSGLIPSGLIPSGLVHSEALFLSLGKQDFVKYRLIPMLFHDIRFLN